MKDHPMSKTIRLNDLQLVLLSSAAARDNGSLIPMPQHCTQDRARIGKAVAALLRRGLIEELPVTDHRLVWREQDQDPIGLFITEAGRAAIASGPETNGADGSETEKGTEEAGHALDKADAAILSDAAAAANQDAYETAASEAATMVPCAARNGSKIATVVAMLERDEGATLDEMVQATGWLSHTTRAALTGLRKKGRTIAKDRRGDVTCYRIEMEQAT
jgi:hypothetical protein